MVIVVGVLVALGVEGIRQEREEARILDEYLTDIADQIRATDFTWGVLLNVAFPEKVAALESLIRFLRDENAPLVDTLLLVGDLAHGAQIFEPWVESDRYEALRSSGTLRLLRDEEVAARLAGAYQGVEVLSGLLDELRSDYPGVALQLVPMESLAGNDPLSGYSRDFLAPGIPGDPDLSAFVRQLQSRRREVLGLARAELALTLARWNAVARMRTEMEEALQALEPWDAAAGREDAAPGLGRLPEGEPLRGSRFLPADAGTLRAEMGRSYGEPPAGHPR
ncbi:MAG TPA: hypothetical protein VK858_04555 [Longimicrobiales bacterium]|nr:hypothetical protein [Longimicrobiales bacterium]